MSEKFDITNHSVPLWLLKNGIKNEKGELIEFNDHLFLWDIYKDQSPKQVIKKCAQIGGSVLMNIKVFFYAKNFGLSSIYTMPSDSDVWEFSQTKTGKIFSANPAIQASLNLDNVGLKQIGETFVYFKGTRSKAAPISTTTDILVHDELDRSDMAIVEIYRSRIVTSKYKGMWLLSNPSFTNMGVDIAWKRSDKKEWHVSCPCGDEQPLKWEDNVDTIREIYVCRSCNHEITNQQRRKGRWIATSDGEYSGYHISQMMAPWLSARDLIREKEERGTAFFNNFVLGEPVDVGEGVNFRDAINNGWVVDYNREKPYFMGIDVGKQKHWVVGTRDTIFDMGVCEKREELEEVIERYNPVIVMDSGPERTWAEEFKQKYPKLFLCFYRRDKNIARMVEWGGEKGNFEDAKNRGYVWIDRNRHLDDVVYKLQEGKYEFALSREQIERLTQHWETMRRVMEYEGGEHREGDPVRPGTERYVWESTTGVNHFASAMWFYELARQRGMFKTELLADERERPKQLIETPMTGGTKMRDLREIVEEGVDYDH